MESTTPGATNLNIGTALGQNKQPMYFGPNAPSPSSINPLALGFGVPSTSSVPANIQAPQGQIVTGPNGIPQFAPQVQNPTSTTFNVPQGIGSQQLPVPQPSTGNPIQDQQNQIIANQQRVDALKASAAQYSASLPPAPTPSPDLSKLTTTSTASSLSNAPSYADLLNAIAKNQQAYLQAGQQSQSELQAQQNLLMAMQQSNQAQLGQQGFNVGLLGEQLSKFGTGAPLESAMAQYQRTGFGAQLQQATNALQVLGAQNAQQIAQTGLSLEQTNRQIRSQVAQNLLNASITEGGLLKPEALSPGASLVSPTGGVAYQGSGFTAPSLAEVATLANQFVSTGQAPDFQTGYQMALGALQTSFGTKGQIHTLEQVNPSTSMTKDNFLGYNLQTYATDPNYATKLAPIVQTIATSVPSYGPQGLQSYISNVAPTSPITGQMVYQASSTYGVDPRVLMGMLQLESQFGTKGAGAKTMNPGNVGNTDSGATQNFPSWQSGLNAMASEIARRQVNQQSQQQIANAPAQVRPAVESLSDGTQYINQDKVPSNFTSLAQLYSAQSGIPILTGEQVGKVQNIDIVTDNLKQMGSVLPTILDSGLFGRLKGLTLNQAEAYLQLGPTDSSGNTILGSFNTYRDTAINAIQALAGGTGSGFRLNQSEIDTATRNLPTITDNLETAQNKLAIVQSFINKWKNELLPNQQVPTNPSQLQPSKQPQAMTLNGTTYTLGTDGLYH